MGLLIAGATGAAPAYAIPNTCPTTGPDAGAVNITDPAAGATVRGQVTVRGRASAPGGVSRVDVFVGEALKDVQAFDPPQTTVQFELRFDAAAVPAGRATVSVVACGGTAASAVRGIASVDVQVDSAAATAQQQPAQLSVVDRAPDRPDRGTGPLWVGLVFGVAGLAGVGAAMRIRGAPVATAPSRDAAPAGPAAAPRPRPDGAASPPRPSPARRRGEASVGARLLAAARARADDAAAVKAAGAKAAGAKKPGGAPADGAPRDRRPRREQAGGGRDGNGRGGGRPPRPT